MRLFPPDPRPPAAPLETVESLFWAALEREGTDRERFLADRCMGQPALKEEIERMLAAHDSAGAFLQVPLPEALARDLPEGRLARWQLLEPIGEGGLGVVYRAVCEEDGVRLEAAVKILRPGFDTGQFRERFVRERQLLAGLDHPAIVRLIDCGADEGGRSFLAMEFVHGEPLDRFLERSNAPASQRLELFETISSAVAYLHSRLIVHGDIKPSNVLVTAEGAPKLLDFGAARWLGPEPNEARGELTRLLLTPYYASPEQKRGEGPSVLSDIYSLGRLLEETLPASGKSSSMSADLRSVCARCLAPDPAARYQSAAEILEDLRRLREGLPVRARRATALYVGRRFVRRNWPIVALTALLLLSLAGGWWNAARHARLATAAAAEAGRQHQTAVEQERVARENRVRAEASARDAVANADRLNALVGELIDDRGADPNILDQQQRAVEHSLRRAAATLEALPGPPRWREASTIWRRVAMLLVHRGEFAAALAPMAKARAAAAAWLKSEPSAASRRNSVLTTLYEVRLLRTRGDQKALRNLARIALAEFGQLPASTQEELNGSVWVENARMAVARDLLARNQLAEVPAMLEAVLRNSEAHREVGTRNLALFNLIYTLRRLNRLEEARDWCRQSQEWRVTDPRYARFCTPPLTIFTEQDLLFTPAPGVLSEKGLADTLARMDPLVKHLHEDPNSFDAKLALGRAYATLATHYYGTGQEDLARPALKQASAIRDALVERDAGSQVVDTFRRRIERLEGLATRESPPQPEPERARRKEP